MLTKHRFFAVALFLGLIAVLCAAQANMPAPERQTKSAATVPTGSLPLNNAASPASGASSNSNCASGPCDFQQPHITIATPAPAPAPWSLQDRIKWLTVVLLVLIAYVGVWLAIATLRKIERQTLYAEVTAQAAADAAKAALTLAENQARAERPWILVTAEATPGVVNSFSVVATNRGRTPARIVALADGLAVVHDEADLPATPIFKGDNRALVEPILLLPGESASLKSFSRDEVKSVCANPEQVQRVEDWEEKVFLYGNVAYKDLSAPSGEARETGWCCWYIHGRQKSGMIMAGPTEYNRHT
ncbi:MAG: hypothetical protein ACP5E2_10410 [Terracidiphilus sp.]